MKIYKAGKQGNLRSVTLFHALARLGYEGLLIVSPEETFISVGFSDTVSKILKVDLCRDLGIPVIRRETGGGAVLLDKDQIFYQLIIKRGSPYLPFKVEDACRKFSTPVIRTYKRLGIEVKYKPISDIVVKGSEKKISGQGAGDIGGSFVFVGNLLLGFNCSLMASLFNVPEESKKMLTSILEENISWVEREIGIFPTLQKVEDILIEEFSQILPFDGEERLPSEVFEVADKLKEELTSEELLMEDTGKLHNVLKIREGVYFSVL